MQNECIEEQNYISSSSFCFISYVCAIRSCMCRDHAIFFKLFLCLTNIHLLFFNLFILPYTKVYTDTHVSNNKRRKGKIIAKQITCAWKKFLIVNGLVYFILCPNRHKNSFSRILQEKCANVKMHTQNILKLHMQ